MQDVREMAEAAGQSFPGFTPPKGETQEQVRRRRPVAVEDGLSSCLSVISSIMQALFISLLFSM